MIQSLFLIKTISIWENYINREFFSLKIEIHFRIYVAHIFRDLCTWQKQKNWT